MGQDSCAIPPRERCSYFPEDSITSFHLNTLSQIWLELSLLASRRSSYIKYPFCCFSIHAQYPYRGDTWTRAIAEPRTEDSDIMEPHISPPTQARPRALTVPSTLWGSKAVTLKTSRGATAETGYQCEWNSRPHATRTLNTIWRGQLETSSVFHNPPCLTGLRGTPKWGHQASWAIWLVVNPSTKPF